MHKSIQKSSQIFVLLLSNQQLHYLLFIFICTFFSANLKNKLIYSFVFHQYTYLKNKFNTKK